MQTAQEEAELQKKKKQQQRVKELDQQFEAICQEIRDEDNIRARTIREKLIEAAHTLKEKYTILGQPEEIKTISSTLVKEFEDIPHVRKYASEYLDKEFKLWSYNKKKDYQNVTDVTFNPGIKKDLESAVNDFIAAGPDAFDRRDNQDLFHTLGKAMEKLGEWSEDTGINLLSYKDKGKSKREVDNGASTEPALPLTDEKHQEKAKMLLNALREHANRILKVADNMESNNYFADSEILDECTLAVKANDELWIPLSNRKWVYDYEGYVKIMKDYKKQSPRYASNNSAIMLPKTLPKKYGDMIDPKTGKKIFRYTMATEQIDVIHPSIHNDMTFIIRNFKPVAAVLYKNFRASEQGYRALRECAKKDKQSEHAFT